MKAIETKYKGYRFRSRLEARWAVFLNHLGIPFSYESEGFDLGNAGRYLPDFWLPGIKAWLEIKGCEPDEAEKAKAEALFEQGGDPVLLAVGEPGYGSLSLFCLDTCDSGGGLSWWEGCRWMVRRSDYNAVVIGVPSAHVNDRTWHKDDYRPLPFVVNDHFCQECHGLNDAFNAARGARFEHGERG